MSNGNPDNKSIFMNQNEIPVWGHPKATYVGLKTEAINTSQVSINIYVTFGANYLPDTNNRTTIFIHKEEYIIAIIDIHSLKV